MLLASTAEANALPESVVPAAKLPSLQLPDDVMSSVVGLPIQTVGGPFPSPPLAVSLNDRNECKSFFPQFDVPADHRVVLFQPQPVWVVAPVLAGDVGVARAAGRVESSTDAMAGKPPKTSVANNALVAHQEIGQKPVVRDLRCPVIGRVVAPIHVGDRRLDKQIVDQVVVIRDRVDHQ
jgi:hypothetical protein